jgi:hypothetical protein
MYPASVLLDFECPSFLKMIPTSIQHLKDIMDFFMYFPALPACPSAPDQPRPPDTYIYIYIHRYFSQLVSSYFKLDFTTSWVRKRRRNTFGEFFWFASVCKTSSLKKQVWHEFANLRLAAIIFTKSFWCSFLTGTGFTSECEPDRLS